MFDITVNSINGEFLNDLEHRYIARPLYLLEKAQLSDPITAYMIIAMLAALSYDGELDEMSASASTLPSIIDAFYHRVVSHESQVPVIKAVVVLQWVLYLSHPARSADAMTQQGERSQEAIKELLDGLIATDVFRFMNDYLCGIESLIRSIHGKKE